VISFDVQVLVAGGTDFVDLSTFTSNNSAFPGTPAVFDTWSQAQDWLYDYSNWNPNPNAKPAATWLPLQLRIQAIQITIRVWDLKSQLARQITIVQDM